jgi:ATP-dependent DNA ligase
LGRQRIVADCPDQQDRVTLVAVGNLSPELEGPVQLELAKAVEQLPGEHGMSGGARYEVKWDGFIH